MKLQIKHSFIWVVLLSLLGIASCSQTASYHVTPAAQTEIRQNQLLAQIRAAGVQVIQQGTRLQMVLPVNRFFETTTTQIKPRQFTTLQRLSRYVQTYTQQYPTRYPIKVYGYTDRVYARKHRKYLSTQYAQVIAAFLWDHGFSSNQLRVTGYGALRPIASERTPRGAAYNRRVVIQVN